MASQPVPPGGTNPPNPSQPIPMYRRFVPIWSMLGWNDEPPGRSNQFPISHPILDRVRPALLPNRDTNPTQYARRFGIFPGRNDGRSKTSPTLAPSKNLPDANAGGTPGGGANFSPAQRFRHLVTRVEDLAQLHGTTLDEYMKLNPGDLALNPNSAACFQAYQDLRNDENWQGILFGGVTMDELHAGGIFTMDATPVSELTGPLDPLLEKSGWWDVSSTGFQRTNPRLLYSFNGIMREYNVMNNEQLWDALKPALQLATRFADAEDPFIAALKDITSRVLIDRTKDVRGKRARQNDPKIKFCINPDPRDPNWPKPGQDLRNYSGFSSQALTRRVLQRCLKIRLVSGHHEESSWKANSLMGVTNAKCESADDDIEISLSAEAVWTLLERGYSESERTVASYLLATTIAHELMHAWEFAHFQSLMDPRLYRVTDDAAVMLLKRLKKEIKPQVRPTQESYFEDDEIPEVGHAFESKVLGGGCWNLSTIQPLGGPINVGDYTGIVCHTKWPDGEGKSKTTHQHLSPHAARKESFSSLFQISHAARCFRTAFWDVGVQRFGMALVKQAPTRPDKVYFDPDDTGDFFPVLREFVNQYSERDARWIRRYLLELKKSKRPTLLCYIKSILCDRMRYDLIRNSFMNDSTSWNHKEKHWVGAMAGTLMVVVEYRTWLILQGSGTRAEKQEVVTLEREFWLQMKDMGAKLDDESTTADGSLRAFKRAVSRVTDARSFEDRIASGFLEISHLLDQELKFQEIMITQLYKLGENSWNQYLQGDIPGHAAVWEIKTNKICMLINCILLKMGDQGIGNSMNTWTSEWQGCITALGASFRTLEQLIPRNGNAVRQNWGDMLQTVPMLRRSSRMTIPECIDFYARREILTMDNVSYRKLEKFKRLADGFVNNLSGLTAFHPRRPDEQAVPAQGPPATTPASPIINIPSPIIGSSTTTSTSSASSAAGGVAVPRDRPAQTWADALNATIADTRSTRARAPSFGQGLGQPAPGQTRGLQGLAQAQAGMPPRIPPQVTAPQVANHPQPFGQSPALLPLGQRPLPQFLSPAQAAVQVHQPIPAQPPGSTGVKRTATVMQQSTTGNLQDLAQRVIPRPPPPTSDTHTPGPPSKRQRIGQSPPRSTATATGNANNQYFLEQMIGVHQRNIDAALTQAVQAQPEADRQAADEQQRQAAEPEKEGDLSSSDVEMMDAPGTLNPMAGLDEWAGEESDELSLDSSSGSEDSGLTAVGSEGSSGAETEVGSEAEGEFAFGDPLKWQREGWETGYRQGVRRNTVRIV